MTCTDQELLFDHTTSTSLEPLGVNLGLDSTLQPPRRIHGLPTDLSDFVQDLAAPLTAETEKAQNLAYLGTLRQQMIHIQACIRSLYVILIILALYEKLKDS